MIPTIRLLQVAALSAAPTVAAAQAMTIQFPQSMQRSDLPAFLGSKDPTAIAVGDINGDRAPDLVYSGLGGGGVYLQGKPTAASPNFVGSGRFFDITASMPPATPPPFGLQTMSCALADLDSDGSLDVLLATSNIGLQIIPLFNNGSGLFTTGTPFNSALGAFNSQELKAGDVDSDGDIDCVLSVVQWPSLPNVRLLLFLNNGNGTFTEATTTNLPVVTGPDQTGVDLFDEDGDGDLDMFVTRIATGPTTGQCLLLRNANGVFTDVTAATIGNNFDAATSASAGDVDGDGDQDIVVASIGTAGSFLLRRGAGGAYARTGLAIPNGLSGLFMKIRLVDVDEDCDLDIVSSHDSGSARTELFLNDGTGTFTSATATRVFNDLGLIRTSLTVADLDADGDNDIIMGNWATTPNPIDIFYNNLRDLDAPLIASVAATSFNFELSFRPAFGGSAVDLVSLAIDTATTSPLTSLTLPREACSSPAGNLLGLTSSMTFLTTTAIIDPGLPVALTGLTGSFVGFEVFGQAAFSDLAGTVHFLTPVTRTLLVP